MDDDLESIIERRAPRAAAVLFAIVSILLLVSCCVGVWVIGTILGDQIANLN
ncbi:MAG TPA: hypothetical protein VFE14_19085 [Micromonosporaceae bacterium]|jgi:hypothetical protein|nr:hypothetical protein [Micromonosporaceae bacterium]